jgi:hypothetical protein
VPCSFELVRGAVSMLAVLTVPLRRIRPCVVSVGGSSPPRVPQQLLPARPEQTKRDGCTHVLREASVDQAHGGPRSEGAGEAVKAPVVVWAS